MIHKSDQSMNLRFAKPSDAASLAQAHEISSSKQPGGFMHRLGRSFLKEYYRILINDGSSVILCAVDAQDNILGFVAGALDAGARGRALKRNRLRLLVASLPMLLRHPGLAKAVYSRQQSTDAIEAGRSYVLQTGAHEEFWAWLPESTNGAIELHLKWLSIMGVLGVHSVRGEVDKLNNMVMRMHRMLGARVIKEFVTPDGRERVVIEYTVA